MTNQNEGKIWRQLLMGLLGIQVTVALTLGLMAIFSFPMLLQQFGAAYQEDMNILQCIMVYNLFLSLSICALSILWIHRDNIAGVQMGITLGGLMCIVSVTVFVLFGRVDILLFDGIRSGLMIVFGIRAYGTFKD